MLRRPSLLLVGPVILLAASALAAEPLFDPRPGHPWDQAREAFYARRFTTGEVFEHPHASAPPWHEYMPFTHDAAFHERVVAVLEAVEKLPPAQMEEQPAPRRLVLLRDLWAAFDALRWAHNRWPEEDKDVATKALARRDELLQRIARVMRRLELTEDEVRALPDAFKVVAEKKLYPKAFDPAAGDRAFFPSDLLDKDGPWLAYAGEKEPTAGGVLHTNFVNQRSVFTLHLRTPDGRDGGLKYFREYIKAGRRLDVPPGSTLALLGRAVVPTRSGRLLVSPLVESLQMIVVTPPEDHRFKFMLDRREMLAGNLGLKPLGKDDPADFSSFGDAILWGHPVDPRKKDANGETFITGKYNTVKDMPRALDVCIKCHRETSGTNIFGGSGPLLPYVQSDPDKADAAVIKRKESSGEWKSYLRLSGRAQP
jgi:hypothetical protein